MPVMVIGRCVELCIRELPANAPFRVLHDPGLHSEHHDRDPVVGLVLDRHSRRAGSRQSRPAHRPHHHNTVVGHQPETTQVLALLKNQKINVTLL